MAARAARGDSNFGRASERFLSERPLRGEQRRPWLLARQVSEEQPATAVTAGNVPVTAGTGVTALVTAVTAPFTEPPMAFTAPVTAITVTESGQRLSPSHFKS